MGIIQWRKENKNVGERGELLELPPQEDEHGWDLEQKQQCQLQGQHQMTADSPSVATEGMSEYMSTDIDRWGRYKSLGKFFYFFIF